MMSAARAKLRVAFQGERGAFSEEAAVALLGARIELVPRPTFEALFAVVAEQAADYVVAPIENTLAGPVERVGELLQTNRLHVVAEVRLHIVQSLIGCAGATLADVRRVESHPVALRQCARFLAAHPQIEPIEADDTAASVRRIVARGDPTCAAIASARAARLYGGHILRPHVADSAENFTRFVLLAAAMPMNAAHTANAARTGNFADYKMTARNLRSDTSS